MPENLYEILSLAMRYWFTLLGGLIVWRAFSWLRKDRRLKHKRLRTLPDAGMIGELMVVEGSRDLPEETIISVPREGVLGFLRSCDVVVPVRGVNKQHADFVFVAGSGLRVFPRRGCECHIDGHEILSRRDAKRHPMGHNSTLILGDAVLRLRLFAGLDAPYHPAYDEPAEEYQPGFPPLQHPPVPVCEEDEDAVTPPEHAPQSFYPPQRSPYAPAPQQGYPYGQAVYPPPYGAPQPPVTQQTSPYAPYPQQTGAYPQQTGSYPPPHPYEQSYPVQPAEDNIRPSRRRRYHDDE